MKTTLKLLGISLLLFSSCTDEEQFANVDDVQKIVMSVEDFKFENQSRTTLTPTDNGATFKWSANDTVGIFPKTGSQIAFPMTSGAGTNTATFTGGGWALKTSTPYMAYYPLQGKFYLDKENIFVSYQGQSQAENASTVHLGKYDYMVASATTPSTNASTVNFQFKHLGALVRLKVKMKETSTLKSVTLQTVENDFILSGYIDLTATSPTINSETTSNLFRINLNNINVEANEDLIVYFLIPPVNLVGKNLKAVIRKDNGYYQEVTLTEKNFEAGKPYELTASMESEEKKPLVINVETAGTFYRELHSSIEGDEYGITSLKVTGNLNGTDIWVIRRMAGKNRDNTETTGQLSYLDMSEANIIAGGDYYYKDVDETEYRTEANVIGSYMFYQCKLKTVKLPVNTTNIGMRSFHTNTSLQSVSIPNGAKYIGMAAFYACKSLQSIEIPNTVKEIYYYAFQDCDALLSVNIPNSVEDIPRAFIECDKLQYIHLPENDNYTVLSTVRTPIENCPSLESLTIPSNISEIAGTPFSGTSIKELHVKRAQPATLDSGAIPSGTKIYVPKGAASLYKTASVWKNFSILEE